MSQSPDDLDNIPELHITSSSDNQIEPPPFNPEDSDNDDQNDDQDILALLDQGNSDNGNIPADDELQAALREMNNENENENEKTPDDLEIDPNLLEATEKSDQPDIFPPVENKQEEEQIAFENEEKQDNEIEIQPEKEEKSEEQEIQEEKEIPAENEVQEEKEQTEQKDVEKIEDNSEKEKKEEENENENENDEISSEDELDKYLNDQGPILHSGESPEKAPLFDPSNPADPNNPLTKLLELLRLRPNPFKQGASRDCVLPTNGTEICIKCTMCEAEVEAGPDLSHPHVICKLRGYKPYYNTPVGSSLIWNTKFKLHLVDPMEDMLDFTLIDSERELGRLSIPCATLNPRNHFNRWYKMDKIESEDENAPKVPECSLRLAIDTHEFKSNEVPKDADEPYPDDSDEKEGKLLELNIIEAISYEGKRRKYENARVVIVVRGCVPIMKSKTCTNTYRPKWNEAFSIAIPDWEHDIIDIILLDGNDIIGQIAARTNQLGLDVNTQKWFKLTTNNSKTAGKIHVGIHTQAVHELPKSAIFVSRTDEKPELADEEFGNEVRQNCIKVTVIEATDLQPAPNTGKTTVDARIIMNMRGYENVLKTHVKRRSNAPKWGESFLIDAPDPGNGVLDFQLLDGTAKNGRVALPVGQICADKIIDGWLDFPTSGRLHFKAEWKRYNPEKPPQNLIKLIKGGKNRLPHSALPAANVKNSSGKTLKTKYVPNVNPPFEPETLSSAADTTLDVSLDTVGAIDTVSDADFTTTWADTERKKTPVVNYQEIAGDLDEASPPPTEELESDHESLEADDFAIWGGQQIIKGTLTSSTEAESMDNDDLEIDLS